jgi:hypothetical protein
MEKEKTRRLRGVYQTPNRRFPTRNVGTGARWIGEVETKIGLI